MGLDIQIKNFVISLQKEGCLPDIAEGIIKII